MKKVKVNNDEFMKIVIEHLNNNQQVEIKVTGNSMLPFYKNERTIVTLKKDDAYKKLDVVLFEYEGQIILHRIIKIKENQYYIRGDGAFRIEIVNSAKIFGKVINFHTDGKQIKKYSGKIKWWLFFTPIRRVLLKFVKK